MVVFRRLWLFYNTLKFLRISQIYFYILFYFKKRIINSLYIKHVSSFSVTHNPSVNVIDKKPYLKNVHNLSQKSFTFLNQEIHFKELINWNDTNLSKLWLYNLHYFDFLIPLSNSVSKKYFNISKNLVLDWINSNPVGYRNGWEPYPLSLRIINWIFFYHYFYKFFQNNREFENIFLKSLYQQCAYLSHFLEFHLMANHLFKNGKALLIGGLFFNRNKWINKGEKILSQEIKEQILPDGGHFERSPMYHSLVLEDVLDLVNFLNSIKPKQLGLTVENLKIVAQNMLEWLEKVVQPDLEIPLFGDSSFAASLQFEELVSYHNKFYHRDTRHGIPANFESLKSSGYYIFRSSEQYLVIDGGNLGVDYQPGHAHCDLFSYEYSYKNERFIVDTGIGEYMNSELRQKARSLNGHNSVVVNDSDQAEIWDAFRMGRRVEPLQVETLTENNNSKFSAIYENWLSKKKKYQHRREIEFIGNKFFHIKDLIKGNRISKTRNLIHFHPDCKLEIEGHGIKISRNENTIYILFSNVQISAEFKDWFYVPEFGKILPSQKVELAPKLNEKGYIPYLIVPSEFLKSAEQYLTDHLVN